MKLLPNVLISILGIGPVYSATIVSSLEISVTFKAMLNLLNIQAMHESNVSLKNSKLKQQGLLIPEIIFL